MKLYPKMGNVSLCTSYFKRNGLAKFFTRCGRISLQQKMIKFLGFLFYMNLVTKKTKINFCLPQSHANSQEEWWVAYLLNTC